jgi:HK97 family phage prohead protease
MPSWPAGKKPRCSKKNLASIRRRRGQRRDRNRLGSRDQGQRGCRLVQPLRQCDRGAQLPQPRARASRRRVSIDCDHDHQEYGKLIYAELGDDQALRCVAVVDGDLTRAEEPVYFSPELELRGDVDKRICIAREAALVGLSLTHAPATLGAWPVSWKYHDPLLERAVGSIGSGLGVEKRTATRIVDKGRRRPLEPGTRGPIEIRSAASVDVAAGGRTIELIAVPYNSETVVEYRGRQIVEVMANTAFARVNMQPNRDRMRAFRDHDMRKVVGRVAHLEPFDPVGLRAEIRVSRTQLGDETLALAEDGIIDASVAFAIPDADGEDWQGLNRRTVRRAWLDHIALTPDPAYADARVLGIRGRELPAQR